MDRILFTTYSPEDIGRYRSQAEGLGAGLECHVFADPVLLSSNGSVEHTVQLLAGQLTGFAGTLGFHGAFYDMISASVDPEVVALTLRRYRQGLHITSQLGGEYIVFHANYMGGWKLANYREGWQQRQVDFWRSFAAEAASRGVYVLIENMWAPEPAILLDLLKAVDNPFMRACFDVSHAALYSPFAIGDWIETLAPYLHVCHLNNTDGVTDSHLPLGTGLIDFAEVLAQLRALPSPPLLTLEMPGWDIVSASLPFLDLAPSS
ncbi:MAG: sugar phosphate isomerase/epimerase family protein [Anaerolineae bacterium]|nr:sugar phosphate isomerase/epimerase family protein [Anaerolineae bacterium]